MTSDCSRSVLARPCAGQRALPVPAYPPRPPAPACSRPMAFQVVSGSPAGRARVTICSGSRGLKGFLGCGIFSFLGERALGSGPGCLQPRNVHWIRFLAGTPPSPRGPFRSFIGGHLSSHRKARGRAEGLWMERGVLGQRDVGRGRGEGPEQGVRSPSGERIGDDFPRDCGP